MQAGLTKAGAEVLHRDIKASVSAISPLSYPPGQRWVSRSWYGANCMEADRSSHATTLAVPTRKRPPGRAGCIPVGGTWSRPGRTAIWRWCSGTASRPCTAPDTSGRNPNSAIDPPNGASRELRDAGQPAHAQRTARNTRQKPGIRRRVAAPRDSATHEADPRTSQPLVIMAAPSEPSTGRVGSACSLSTEKSHSPRATAKPKSTSFTSVAAIRSRRG